MNRRRLGRLALASGLASSLPALWPLRARAAANDKLKIGFVYSGPIADIGWTYQHDQGRKAIEKEFGAKVETAYVESVPESADADRVIRQFASDGCKMIFTTSFGFMDPTQRVAAEFPDVMFEHCSGYKMAKNVGIYQTRFYEGAYLLGLIAGKMSKSNTLGYVAPFPIPEVIRNLSAWTTGARSVNPGIGVKVVWVNTWYDPGKEREAAQALIDQGADVLYQNTDSSAVVQLAQSKGLFAFGQDSDMTRFGPRAHLSGNVANWSVYYVHKVKQMLEGRWKPEDTKWGMKEGMVQVVPPNAQVPKDLAAMFDAKKAEIISGKLHAFSGPLKDTAGSLRIAAGKTMAEDELWTMKWYAEGVLGKQP
jgi:basic membrane protein A and related proteins